MTTQVNEEIRLGKLVTKTLFLGGGSGRIDHRKVGRGQRARIEVSATRPYTASEKLAILLSALERVLGTEDMQNATHVDLYRLLLISRVLGMWAGTISFRASHFARNGLKR